MTPRLSLVIVLGLAVLALAPNAQAQQPGVRAESGGIAVGNVSGSTITIGIPPEQLEALIRQSAEHSETQKKLISELEGKLDLNQRQVRAALDILGEKDIPPERLAARLVEIAERFKVLQATALAQPGDDAKIAALKAEAQKAIEAGDLTKADALLAEVESDQQRMLDTLAVNAAETSARRGDIALARLRYGDAARHFANAAAVFPPESTHQDKRIDNLQKEADALYRQGDEFGDNGALLSAIERERLLLNLMARERVPLDWARTQHNLGNALSDLGAREGGTQKLEEAVIAFHEALKERTRERTPLDWAETQRDLGGALFRLGTRESGTEKLEDALAAYREAMKEHVHERYPTEWATIQNNIGAVLSVLGSRERVRASSKRPSPLIVRH